jgi:uncharacterized membrane protein YccC
VETSKDSTTSQQYNFSSLEKPESFTNSWQHSLLTAFATVISLLLVRLLPLSEGYWAAISAAVVMQSDIRPTITAGRDRLLGTGIGAVIGWLTALIWHDNLLVFGLAVAVSLMACNALGLKSAGRLVGATICLMVLVPAAGPKWRIPLDRFIEVSVGILTAVTISLLHYHLVKRRALAKTERG